MSIDENKKEAGTESGAEGGLGTTQPATSYTKEETTRIGTKEDIREVGDEEGDSPPEQGDKLRDGTK